MARLVEPNATDLCVEHSEEGQSLHAVKVIAVGGKGRIPLCKHHLDELIADLAAEGLE